MYERIPSNSEKFTGSFPKKVESEEYEEIGILKPANDSKKAITISTSTIIDKSLKTIFRFLMFEENKIILAVIMNPQIK